MGWTPLRVAAARGLQETVEFLRQYGATE
jgi:hypothetical protein